MSPVQHGTHFLIFNRENSNTVNPAPFGHFFGRKAKLYMHGKYRVDNVIGTATIGAVWKSNLYQTVSSYKLWRRTKLHSRESYCRITRKKSPRKERGWPSDPAKKMKKEN